MTEQKKYNFVYLTTNLVNGKQYVGDHSTNDINFSKSKTYFGSGKIIKDALKLHKKENFNKEILEFFSTKQEAFNAQTQYIIKYDTLVPNGYNISPTGGIGCPGCHSKETKLKIGKAREGKPGNIQGPRLDLIGEGNGMFKKSVYERWIEIYSIEEADVRMKTYVEHLSNSMKGNTWKLSDESKVHRKNILLKTIGVDNISKLPEVRKKISNSLKGNIAWNKGEIKKRCYIYNDDLNKTKTIKIEELVYWLNLGWLKGVKTETRTKRIGNPKNNTTFNRCWINKNGENKFAFKNELDYWLEKGWNRGRKIIKK